MAVARRALRPVLVVLLAAAAISALSAAAEAQPCSSPSALGVSRTLDIDTTGGPRFGAQYPGHDLLQPGEVVLTFDDGPMRSHTPAVLKALAAHCTRATFFTVGRMALAEPELLRDIALQGHTIGLHTWSHRKLTATSTAKAVEEIELGHSVVEKTLGRRVTPFFRFPYLAASHSMLDYLAKQNIAVMGIDVDSQDFRTRKPDVMAKNVLTQLQARGKGIILFHDIQPSTANGLKTLLDELKKRGFKVVHFTSTKTAETLPEYDQKAEKLIARRQVAGAMAEKPPPPASPDSPDAMPGPEELPWLRKENVPQDRPAQGATKKPWWEF